MLFVITVPNAALAECSHCSSLSQQSAQIVWVIIQLVCQAVHLSASQCVCLSVRLSVSQSFVNHLVSVCWNKNIETDLRLLLINLDGIVVKPLKTTLEDTGFIS